MSSRSPSPASVEFAANCLIGQTPEDEGRKRARSPLVPTTSVEASNKIVAETLLPDTYEHSPRKHYRPEADDGPSSQTGVVQETVIVPHSQTGSDDDDDDDDAAMQPVVTVSTVLLLLLHSLLLVMIIVAKVNKKL